MKLPDQPQVMVDGILRFRKNRLVEFLLDAGPFDMNALACLPEITDEEYAQFAQLIGYSWDGYHDLSYAHKVERKI